MKGQHLKVNVKPKRETQITDDHDIRQNI